MANMTMQEADAKLRAAGIPHNSFKTVFLCARNGISLSHYARLEKAGKGCKFIDLDGVKVHTLDQEREWLAMLAAETESAA
jgi:hypothetical protein